MYDLNREEMEFIALCELLRDKDNLKDTGVVNRCFGLGLECVEALGKFAEIEKIITKNRNKNEIMRNNNFETFKKFLELSSNVENRQCSEMETLSYIEFLLNYREYCLEILSIKEGVKDLDVGRFQKLDIKNFKKLLDKNKIDIEGYCIIRDGEIAGLVLNEEIYMANNKTKLTPIAI